MRILVIEDEFNLADIIATRLKKEKYSVDIASDGEEGLYLALNGSYNLILLDIMLPKVDGIKIIQEIRKEEISPKVIMLTAKSELEDKLIGFNFGADDYVTKPFHLEELVARINVQLRKDNSQNLVDTIEVFDLELNMKTAILRCTKTNELVEVGNKEFLILEYFMQNQNIILSKEQIYDKVWGIDNLSESNNLEAYLSFIRRKLKIIGSTTSIKAIRGLGYRMEDSYEKTKE